MCDIAPERSWATQCCYASGPSRCRRCVPSPPPLRHTPKGERSPPPRDRPTAQPNVLGFPSRLAQRRVAPRRPWLSHGRTMRDRRWARSTPSSVLLCGRTMLCTEQQPSMKIDAYSAATFSQMSGTSLGTVVRSQPSGRASFSMTPTQTGRFRDVWPSTLLSLRWELTSKVHSGGNSHIAVTRRRLSQLGLLAATVSTQGATMQESQPNPSALLDKS